jgi:hypothetical protein
MKIGMEDLYQLPTADRRDYIRIHNLTTENEKRKMGAKH